MTRIDMMRGSSGPSAERSTLPSGVVRRAFGCGGCMLAFLAAAGLACVVTLMFVAQVGAFKVPILSDMLYHPAPPEREVTPLAGYSQEDVLRSVGARAYVNPATGTIATTVTEQELTTIVAKGMAEAEKDGAPPLTDVQFVITETAIEFSAVTPGSERTPGVPVLVTAVPRVEDGKLAADIERIAIGSLEVPDLISSFVAATLGSHVMRALQDGIASVGTLQRLDLQDGRMTVTLRPDDPS
jgi:hypothetical protein